MFISFILEESSTPENVRASARALKTMGTQHLLRVNPCDHLGAPAQLLAHGSVEIPENAGVEFLLKKTGFNEIPAIYPRFLKRIGSLKKGDIHLLHSFCNKLLE